jgi:hypothetical protein
MTIWRRTAGWAAVAGGVASILLGAFVCFRSLQRYYYAYGPATDDLEMRHIKVTFEIEVCAVTLLVILSGFALLRLAKNLTRSG